MITFYLDKKGPKIDSPIFLAVRYDGRRIKAYTGRKINQKYWDVEKGRADPKRYKLNCIDFNGFLQRIEDKCISLLNKNRPITKHELKQIIDQADGLRHEKDFFAFADEFLHTTNLAYNTIKGFRTTLKHLRGFRPSITFNGFDMTFYRQFTHYLREKLVLGENTVGDNIKRIKRILNAALDEGLHSNLDFKKSSFKTPSIVNDEVYLTAVELSSLYKASLSKQLEKYRDAFLLHCAFGIRYEDGIQISPQNFSKIDNIVYIQIMQGKTGTSIQIPVLDSEFKFVKPLLRKYKNTHPCVRKGKLVSVQKFNQFLREACKTSKALDTLIQLSINGERVTRRKYECIKSHTARRTFSTLLYLNGYPIQLIMSATGHKKESTFLKYVRADQLTAASKLANFQNRRFGSQKWLTNA
jgi:integrase